MGQEFEQIEADNTYAIDGLNQAIPVLRNVQLIQKGSDQEAVSAALLQVRSTLDKVRPVEGTAFAGVMQKDLWDMLSSLGSDSSSNGEFLPRSGRGRKSFGALQTSLLPWEKTEEQSGMDAKPNELEGEGAGAKSYNSRSGRILGLLEQMRDGFTADLAKAKSAEQTAVEAFQKLMDAKTQERVAAETQKKASSQAVADLETQIVAAKSDLAQTKQTKEEDEKILATLGQSCASSEEEFQARQGSRSEELAALRETIKILTEDDARSLFGKTMSFMQVSASTRVVSDQSSRVDAAASSILDVAMAHKDMVLASLSMRVRLDSFTVVIKAIDGMIAQLKQEQADEVVRHDTCLKDLDTNDDNLKANRNEHRLLSNSMQEAQSQEETLQNEKEGFESRLKEEREQSKKAGLDRKEENLVYQQSVADQRLTVFILHKAEARLHAFYAPKPSLLSAKASAVLEPPPDQGAASTYEKSGTAPGVLQLLASIISDATKEEATLVKTEQHAQDVYAAYVKDSNQLMTALISNIEAHTQSILDTQATIAEFKESLETVDVQHDDLNKVKADTHSECDFTLKYFQVRQGARSEEWTALENAKAILRGSDFDVAQTTDE